VTPVAQAIKQGHPVEAWQALLAGRRVVISFQTRVEVIAGASSAKWGQRRMDALFQRIDATPTVLIDDEVMEAFVTLTVAARAHGSGIGHKHHVADRWIAACAIAKSLPLLSGDDIFADAPGVTRLDAAGS